MCGIVGIHSPTRVPDKDVLLRMMTALSHRGPDGSGYFRDATVALGHTRLAIIDPASASSRCAASARTSGSPSTARSSTTSSCAPSCATAATRSAPTATPRSSCTPGRSGARGASSGSTASGRWRSGTGAPRRLVLSRDRLGVRPLYYTTVAGAAALRLRGQGAVRRPAGRSGRSTRSDWTRSSRYWSTVAPRTVFRGVEQVVPGHYAVVDAAGSGRPPLLAALASPSAGRRADPGRRGERRRPARAPHRGDPAAVPAQRRPRGRLPVRRHRLRGHRGGHRATSPTPPCTRSRCASPTPSSTKAIPVADGSRGSGRPTTTSWSRTATSRRCFPRSSGTPRRRCCAPRRRRCSCSRGWCGRTATRSSSPARAPTRCSPATTSSARRRSGSSGPATRVAGAGPRGRAALPLDGPLPRPGAGLRPHLLRAQPGPGRPGALAPAALGLHGGAQVDADAGHAETGSGGARRPSDLSPRCRAAAPAGTL